jgi:hypothetical protein
VDFWFRLAEKKPKIHFSAPKAGLSGQKSIERTQKYVVLGVFGHFPKISKRPYAKSIIDTALSFEDRSGATMSFEHVNFQPRASKAQNFYFFQNAPCLWLGWACLTKKSVIVAIAVTMPIVTAFKFCIRHRKKRAPESLADKS